MFDLEEFLNHFAKVRQRTRRVAECIPADRVEWAYKPGAFTLGDLVRHIAVTERYIWAETVHRHRSRYKTHGRELADGRDAILAFMKMAATEDSPAIKTYEEQLWAELPDAKTAPADLSLSLLEALHRRWVLFLKNLSDAEYARTFKHPDWGTVTIDEAVALYEWHCRHHLAHVEQALAAAVL